MDNGMDHERKGSMPLRQGMPSVGGKKN